MCSVIFQRPPSAPLLSYASKGAISATLGITVLEDKIYKKVIVKVLKKTIKVWSRRDSKLKGDCRGLQRHIRLIKSPAAINDHNTNLGEDITNWAVSDPGNIFCHIDKPYLKNQTREPAMAVCIDNINIFAQWSFGSLGKTVYRLPNNTDAILGYFLLNKIAPLVSPKKTAPMQYFNKLEFREIPTLPLFTSKRSIHNSNVASSPQNVRMQPVTSMQTVYKAPGQANGKIIEATAPARDWQDGAQALSNNDQHSFAKALQHVVGNDNNIKFLAYNNAPPGVANVKTKSNSKGVIILATNADSAAWIVHTVPGFPAAKTGYSWPVAENNRGHLLICLTILESQINAIETAGMPYFNKLAEGKIPTLPPFTSRQTIRTQSPGTPVTVHIYSKSESSKYAASLLLVQPLIHYNDIPKTETAGMPYFNKLAEGKISTLPPFTSRQTIRTQSGAAPVTVHIYSKSESSKYEIFKKVIVKVLKKTIKVWSRRDSKLKGDCRGSQRHIRLIKSPAAINGHNTNLESDITNWAVSDPGNIFCHIDKPYFKNQTREPAMALLALFFFIKFSHSQTSKCQNKPVYKAPGQDTSKIIFATVAGSWDNGAIAFTNNGGHSFAKTLENVVRDHINIKFLAYSNAPPGVANVNTKSNSKGLIILSTAADSASWIVHTVPGFPTARTPYSWPAAENARGHLLNCLTISESQINAIAASLLLVEPMVHYNDIPETETAGMPYFNMLAGGKIPTLPPFTSRRSIHTENAAGPVAVYIYSKSRSSKYVLKKTIKVWSRRDNILKGDCRGSQRQIRLIKSPAAINGHNTNLEADITNWAVSDPGNIFCHVDKPYFKNQTREPAMAVCIDNNEIFARFNEIAAQVEDCPQ
ncbi:Deoxyribonuclease-2-alpha [Trichinella sp. T9]|nr:Deoxyribonuclease-2-alpha [Trichinella sp. T9]